MKTASIFFLPFYFLSLLTTAQHIDLTKQGVSSYIIITSSKPPKIEQQAAQSFQNYIQKITGATLPIANDAKPATAKEVVIGNTNRYRKPNGIAEDGVLMKTINSKLIITGGSRYGVLFAVYELLERFLDCKMLSSNIEIIPTKPTLSLPEINYAHNPSFTFRNTAFKEVDDQHYLDWHKLNILLGEYGVPQVHTFGQLLPPDVYFKTHPEYYALVDGVRKQTQPCLSQPEVYAIMVANLKKFMATQPAIKYWSVSQNDGFDYCHCNLCEPKYKTDGYMGALLPFVNKVASQFPNKIISTFAYLFSEMPPKTVKPAKNVEIVYCTWNTIRNVPISTSGEVTAVKIVRYITDWRKLTPNILVWDYLVNFENALSPFPNLHTIKPNIKMLSDRKINRTLQQGIGSLKGEFSELKCYLIAKLLWDINADDSKIIEQFVKDFYGPGAPYISSYLKLMQQEATKGNIVLRMSDSPDMHQGDYLSAANRAKYRSLFQQAENATLNTPHYDRVVRERLALDYADIKIEAANPTISKLAFTEKTNRFLEDTRKYNISAINEARQIPQDFINSQSQIRNSKN
jgi:hypothetical protein